MAEDACCEGHGMCCSKNLKIVEVKCPNCRMSVYVFEDNLRENTILYYKMYGRIYRKEIG